MALRERKGVVTMGGTPLTLLGDDVSVGAPAPNFRVVDGNYREVKLSDFWGRTVLVSAVPSLDTGVCAMQTRRFNEEAAGLGEETVILTISMDLPFAQSRFCKASSIEKVKVLSDHVRREFGEKYGILIKENMLLARSIWVISPDGKVTYKQVVPELTSHPDYDAALKALM